MSINCLYLHTSEVPCVMACVVTVHQVLIEMERVSDRADLMHGHSSSVGLLIISLT